MDKLLHKTYFIFLATLPLVFYPGIYDVVLLPREVSLGIFLLLITGALLYKGYPPVISRSPAYTALGIFMVCNMIASFNALVISESLAALTRYFSLFTFLWLTTALLGSGKISENGLYTAVMVFGMIGIVMGFGQIGMKGSENIHVFRAIQDVYGGFANKNLLASILFLCFPFFLGARQISKRHKVLSYMGILLAAMLLIVIRTRTVFIASAMYSLICAIFLLRLRYKAKAKHIFAGALSAIGILTLAVVSVYRKVAPALTSSSDIRRQYFFRLFDSKTFQSRTRIWQKSWEMFFEHPFGVGPGNWQVNFPKYRLDGLGWQGIESGAATIQRPHNDFLWVLCETGIIGLLAYISIFLIIIYQLLRLIKHAPNNQKWRFIHLLSTVAGYVIIAFFDFPLERNEHQILLMLIFAITFYHYKELNNAAVYTYDSRILWGIFACLLFCTGLSVVRLKASVHSETARMASTKDDWDTMASESEKSESPFFDIDALTIPVEWYRGAAIFQGRSADFGLDHFQRAVKITPYNVRVVHDLASAYEKNGNHKLAVEYYLKALKISPEFDEARINLAASYFNSGQFDKAFDAIERVDIHCKLPSYKMFLAPIVEKKINSLLKNAAPKTIAYWQARLKTPDDLILLYFEYKRNSVTFTQYILKTNLI